MIICSLLTKRNTLIIFTARFYAELDIAALMFLSVLVGPYICLPVTLRYHGIRGIHLGSCSHYLSHIRTCLHVTSLYTSNITW